ncbi:MAG: hypothetical protein ABWY82_23690 [Tardiphaga sp.]
MTVRMQDGVILLEGDCPSGDAEDLLQVLLTEPAADIDWRTCKSAHTAVVQVLLAARRDMLGPPLGAVLASIARALARKRE